MLHRWIRRVGLTMAGILVALLGAVAIFGQQPVIGVFSRIYLGGTGSANPQIRWGAATPTGACTPGTFYLQNVTPSNGGPVWFCLATSSWRQVADTTQVGNDFFADALTYGAKCDGDTDDTVAINGAIAAAYAFGKAGHVVLPPGVCKTGPIVFGAITDPWQQSASGPGFMSNVNVSFTAPRAATIVYSASSTTITWAGSVITSADIGNYVFYGTDDASFTAVGETRVTKPTYGCTITAILTSTSATCVGTTLNWQVGPTLAPTTGSHASYITNDHDFTINDSNDLTNDNLNKSFTFAVPVVRAPQNCLALPCVDRPGPHDHLEVYNTPTPCVGSITDDWQCFNGGNVKLKYFNATVTAVTDTKHGKMSIAGLAPGSNWLGNFPAFPNRNSGAFTCAAYGPLLSDCGLVASNPHIDHYIDMTALASYLQASTGVGQFFAYEQPIDTSQRFMSFRGASQAATILSFTGCDGSQWANACAALIFSRNKYFTWEDMSVSNASGSDPDDLTQWGVYMGGLPSGGTQTLQFTANRIGISGFGVGLQLGDDQGGEMSDSVFNQLAVTSNGIGVRIGPGSPNTLDLTFNELAGGFNKIGLADYEGNTLVNWGSFSFNDIDFLLDGFGPVSVNHMRTEGPGIPFVGGETSTYVSGNNIAEPQATRLITGNVVGTPNSTHSVASVAVSNVSVGVPTQSFYPITFSASAFTAADLRKIIIIPGLGTSGTDVIAQVWTVDSSTTGTVFVTVKGSIVSSGTVTVAVYDNNLADLTFPVNAITAGDIGSSVALPSSTVGGGKAVRCAVTSVSSTTAGQCGFFLGNQGAGPVITGTSTNPDLFVNTAVYWASSGQGGGHFDTNSFPTGRFYNAMVSGGRQALALTNNSLLSLVRGPVTYRPGGPAWELNLVLGSPDLSTLPTPSSDLTHGIRLPWHLVDATNNSFDGVVSTNSNGNTSMFYGGPVALAIPDGLYSNVSNVMQLPLVSDSPQLDFDTALNPFALQVPSSPVNSTLKFSRVTSIGEAQSANGKNLRVACTFGNTPGTPSVALAGAGAGNVDNGTHQYYVTFVGINQVNVSSAGSVTVVDKTSDGQVSLTSIAVGPTGTTSRKVWRTLAGTTGLANAKLLTTIANNSATTFTDNVADGSLGASAPTYGEVTCPFLRSEAYETRRGLSSPTTYDPLTRTYGILVTSGHFTTDDLGKVFHVSACCGEGTLGDFWGVINAIVDATHITAQQMPGSSNGFPNGGTTGSASVGLPEPDANWVPAGMACTALESFGYASTSASNIVFRSSNTQSAATCRVLVVR